MTGHDIEKARIFGDAVASLPVLYQMAVAGYINGLKAGASGGNTTQGDAGGVA